MEYNSILPVKQKRKKTYSYQISEVEIKKKDDLMGQSRDSIFGSKNNSTIKTEINDYKTELLNRVAPGERKKVN